MKIEKNTVKLATRITADLGVTYVVRRIIETLTPPTENAYEVTMQYVGSAGIAMLVEEPVEKIVDRSVDEVYEFCGQIRDTFKNNK